MTKDEEIALRELAAGQCTIQKVVDALGPLSLWSDKALKAEIHEAVLAEREVCAKLCDLALFQCQETMNELDATEHIAQCIVQGAMNQAVKLSNAIRARGQA